MQLMNLVNPTKKDPLCVPDQLEANTITLSNIRGKQRFLNIGHTRERKPKEEMQEF